MAPLTTETHHPLSLSEQLDAMLLGWLERNADRRPSVMPHPPAKAVVTVVASSVPEVEAFCANWDMTVTPEPVDGGWAVLVIEGPSLPVQGFSEITGMYRR